MGGQIVDATLVAALKQRNTAAEKEEIKAGKSVAEIWPDQPGKAAEGYRCTLDAEVRQGPATARRQAGERHRHPELRRQEQHRDLPAPRLHPPRKVTDGARFDVRMLRDVVTNDNTASDVWADTAYRSRSNEAWLRSIGRVSRVYRKKPEGKPIPARNARANAVKSTVRARIEHVFARQKDQMALFIRTVGIARAETKIALANLVHDIDRLIFHERRAVMG